MASKTDAAKARLARRVAAAPNEKVAEIMALEDRDGRWEKLREAGYCGYGAGSCRADNGKVAKCEIKASTGKPYRACAAHLAYQREMNAKYLSSIYRHRQNPKRKAAPGPEELQTSTVTV